MDRDTATNASANDQDIALLNGNHIVGLDVGTPESQAQTGRGALRGVAESTNNGYGPLLVNAPTVDYNTVSSESSRTTVTQSGRQSKLRTFYSPGK
jgi:hypothetical protein